MFLHESSYLILSCSVKYGFIFGSRNLVGSVPPVNGGVPAPAVGGGDHIPPLLGGGAPPPISPPGGAPAACCSNASLQLGPPASI